MFSSVINKVRRSELVYLTYCLTPRPIETSLYEVRCKVFICVAARCVSVDTRDFYTHLRRATMRNLANGPSTRTPRLNQQMRSEKCVMPVRRKLQRSFNEPFSFRKPNYCLYYEIKQKVRVYIGLGLISHACLWPRKRFQTITAKRPSPFCKFWFNLVQIARNIKYIIMHIALADSKN